MKKSKKKILKENKKKLDIQLEKMVKLTKTKEKKKKQLNKKRKI